MALLLVILGAVLMILGYFIIGLILLIVGVVLLAGVGGPWGARGRW